MLPFWRIGKVMLPMILKIRV